MTDPQPPYPIRLPITLPADTPFAELPGWIQQRILAELKTEEDDG